MDTAKPLNPSNKVGEADDLIEELARMMAEGAKGGSGKPVAPPLATPARANPAVLAGAGGNSNPQSPSQQITPAASNDSAPVAESRPAGETLLAPKPGFSPVPARPISSVPPANPGAPAAESTEFKFELGGGGQAKAPSASPATPPAARQNASGQPAAVEPTVSAVVSNPAVAAANQPSNDPIAELIRNQLQPNPAQSSQLGSDLQDGQHNQGQNHSLPEPSTLQTAAPEIVAPDAQKTQDSFNVPPVFGLGGPPSAVTPASAAPAVASAHEKSMGSSDALDEIEKLIGNAVRVDFPHDSSAQQAVEGPPAVRTPPVPQTTEVQPNVAAIATPSAPADGGTAPNVDAAEAAILQAMGATQSASNQATTPGVVRPAGELPQEELLAGTQSQPNQAKTRSTRKYMIPALAALLLIGAAAVGYFALNPGAGDGDVPVLVADVTPAKQDPEPSVSTTDDQSVVFDGIDGNSVPVEEQRLLSRDQTDGATSSEIRQVVTTDNTEAGLANRRVRTVTVRPDGTIISGDAAVAGGEVLPVAQPELPELPAGAVNTELASTTVAALPEATDSPPLSLSSLAPNSEIFAVNGTTVPFPLPRVADRSALASNAVNNFVQTPQSTTQTTTQTLPAAEIGTPAQITTTPQPTTSNPGAVDLIATLAAQSVVEEPTPVIAVTPPPAAIVATTQPVANPTAFVQLASLRRQDVAEETAANLQSRYSSSLQGGTLEVRRVDLGDRGIFFRVLLPSATLADASSVCNAIQNAGGDCFPRNN